VAEYEVFNQFVVSELSKGVQRHLFNYYQVPEGSGTFAHSSLKTPFSVMGTHDGCPVPSSKKKFDNTLFFFPKFSPDGWSFPKKNNH
jgi:hypothetical protein